MSETQDRYPLRLGIVGGGEAAQKALSAIHSEPHVDVVGVVCDEHELEGTVPKSLRFSKVEELLDRVDIEALYIATPNHTHVHFAQRAAACGRPVLAPRGSVRPSEHLGEILTV